MKKKIKFRKKTSQSCIFANNVLKIVTFPFRLLCYFFIYIYKLIISPLLPKTCRYNPSCSTYALEAIKNHGVIKGIVLAYKRLRRCTPKNKSGYDPVPANIKG